MPRKPKDSQELPPNQNSQELLPNQPSEKAAESAEHFQAGEPPHLGDVNEAPPEAPEGTAPETTVRRRRGRKKKELPVVQVIAEPTKDDIDDARFVLEMVLFTPSEELLGFTAPEEKQQLRMARIGARIMLKYFDIPTNKDEYKLCGLLFFWVLGNCWRKFGGKKSGQRNNGSLRPEAPRKNPLDVATPTGATKDA